MFSYAQSSITNRGRGICDFYIGHEDEFYVNLLFDRSIYQPMCTHMGNIPKINNSQSLYWLYLLFLSIVHNPGLNDKVYIFLLAN